eukprot:TRINITY_DN455_c1_g2_i1.p1 TRINITY_DN455_c1_g2~~TRINITY_DN455_c1_g2_i1.p1  ORF type:complete len:711 (+),score=171.04 TRINITY_DN455_c1_g2_i1:294-2135(+)
MGVPGAILSDSKWGKFRTIWRFSTVYVVGCVTLSLTAIPGFMGEDAGPNWLGCFLGLLLIAVGTGGIKPNVSSFGGDQFSKTTSQNIIETFFSAFYLTVNIGSVASTFTTPIVREEYGYAAAFGVPAVLLIIAITVFLFGSHLYTRIPPAGSIVVVAMKVVRDAWKFVCFGRTKEDLEEAKNAKKSLLLKDKGDTDDTEKNPQVAVHHDDNDDDDGDGDAGKMGGINEHDHEHTIVAIGEASGSADGDGEGDGNIGIQRSWTKHDTDGKHWIFRALLVADWDEKTIEGVSIVVRVIRVLSPIIMFWALFDQHGSRWVAQASEMDRNLGFIELTPDQMTMFNPALLMLLIPVFDRIIYPALRNCGLKLLALNRMKVGMVFASASFVSAGLVQMEIDARGEHNKVHVMWQIPQYFLLSCGEILISISGLEFAYSQAPKEMKSVLQSVWLMTTALGNLIVVLVAGVSLMTSMWEYFFFAGMMFIVFLLFLVIVRGYEYVRRDDVTPKDSDENEDSQSHQQDRNDDDDDDEEEDEGDASDHDRVVDEIVLDDTETHIARAQVSYGSIMDRSEDDRRVIIGSAASPMHDDADDGDDAAGPRRGRDQQQRQRMIGGEKS